MADGSPDSSSPVDAHPDAEVSGGGSGGRAVGGAGGGGAAGSSATEPSGRGGAVVPASSGGVGAGTGGSPATADAGSADAASERDAAERAPDVPASVAPDASTPTPCPAGAHRCGSACVPDSSPETCGSTCAPCAKPANATATCDGTSCGFVCALGANRCGTGCALPDDVTACGPQCLSCPAPTNGSPVCANGTCDFRCRSGFHRCGSSCVSDTSPDSCGSSCAPCFAPAGATAGCEQGQCTVACPPGQSLCGQACIPPEQPCAGRCAARLHLCGSMCSSDFSVATCGGNCLPCPIPDGATGATCDGTRCGVVCAADRHRCGDTCPAPDRSVACIGATATSNPRSFLDADNTQVVVFVTNGHVTAIEHTASGPVVTDLTAAAGAVPCASEVSGYLRSDEAIAIVYRGTDKHVHELSKERRSSWRDTDLTADAGSGVVSDADPHAYVRSDGVDVVVFRKDGHINQMERVMRAWRSRDLTVESFAYLGAPVVGNPMGYRRTDQNNAIVYRDSTGRVREITLYSGLVADHDLFEQSQTETIPAVGDPWGYISSSNTNSVIYVGTDGAVHEVLLTLPAAGTGWTSSVLPSANGAGRPSGQVDADGRRVVVYRTLEAGIPTLRALAYDGSWSALPLPASALTEWPPTADPFVGLTGARAPAVMYLSQGNELVSYRPLATGGWQVVTY